MYAFSYLPAVSLPVRLARSPARHVLGRPREQSGSPPSSIEVAFEPREDQHGKEITTLAKKNTWQSTTVFEPSRIRQNRLIPSKKPFDVLAEGLVSEKS